MKDNFTEGKIWGPLLRFGAPILLALFLQSLYGAVDLLVVGQFGTAADVSAVATGSQMLQMMTVVITGLGMGTTVLVGQTLGRGRSSEAGNIIESSICFFGCLGLVLTLVLLAAAPNFATLMQAPKEAFAQTVSYVRICGVGIIFIVAYNVLGSVFRGLGDSRTPLLTVLFASIFNVFGDLFFVAYLQWQAAGAAVATVLAQALSVMLSIVLVHRQGLPFAFGREHIRFDGALIRSIAGLGFPVALQDALVGISFLAINAIVNSLGVVPSAGVGVAEKICGFIMLVPSAFSQSLTAFVAHNIGAGKVERATKAMFYGMKTSVAAGIIMAYIAFFQGQALSSLFTADKEVVYASADYLRAYGFDTLLVSFLFCFMGYFNGGGKTRFVMVQGIVGAFLVRIPVSYIMSKQAGVTLFEIGLATPASTVIQIILCALFFHYVRQTEQRNIPRLK